MNYLKIDNSSFVDGYGVRTVLWVAGCSLHCKHCWNPESWDFHAGKTFDNEAKEQLYNSVSKPWIAGLTLSGGHPLDAANIKTAYDLLTDFKSHFSKKNVWLYTGFELSPHHFNPQSSGLIAKTLALCDVVVDGPFDYGKRDIALAFRGSTNQRLIDVHASRQQKRIVLLDKE